jgi:flagellin
MEQLSTGKRINGVSDDAAGLAISNKMTSQIKGLNRGSQCQRWHFHDPDR